MHCGVHTAGGVACKRAYAPPTLTPSVIASGVRVYTISSCVTGPSTGIFTIICPRYSTRLCVQATSPTHDHRPALFLTSCPSSLQSKDMTTSRTLA